jgi:hypothetical protein
MTLRRLFQAPENDEVIRQQPVTTPRGKLNVSMEIDGLILENDIVHKHMAKLRLEADDLPVVKTWEPTKT